jgi:phosphoribosyl 1,2-cyclic phosphate phosphodiesterase
MELTILGTAAAEGWPSPFCLCPICQQARRRGGPDFRTRSGALLDDDLKIDFGPDTVVQLQRAGRNLGGLRSILVTHSHSDHLAVAELQWARRPFTRTPPAQPIVVFGPELVMAAIRSVIGDRADSNLELRLVRPLEPFETPTGDRILPLPAEHAPGSVFYRITRAGRTLLWALDTGVMPSATLDAIGDGVELDIAVFDCTTMLGAADYPTHMGLPQVVAMISELLRRKAITDRTRCIVNHFSHNGNALHEDMVRACLPQGIAVAYDGMTVST